MKNKKIAILGANSQIAKDLNELFDPNKFELFLFSRKSAKGHLNYSQFSNGFYDYIFNFIGYSDPKKIIENEDNLFDIWNYYDDLVINYLKKNINCKYFYISSGAIYQNFDRPPDKSPTFQFNLDKINELNKYNLAKLFIEIKHHQYPKLFIVNLRIFNYISSNLDIDLNFFITNIIRSIKNKESLVCSSKEFYRDFICADDVLNVFNTLKKYEHINSSFDIYSKSAVSNIELLRFLSKEFALHFQFDDNFKAINSTGYKKFYYSNNKKLKKYGYKPKFTSLECINNEFKKIFN